MPRFVHCRYYYVKQLRGQRLRPALFPTIRAPDVSFWQASLNAISPRNETVVLLHGFPDTRQTFNALATYLRSNGFDVLVPSLPGYASFRSSSSAPNSLEPYKLENLTTSLLAYVRENCDGQRIHVVGHDWGSVIAQSASIRSPETFLSVTLLAVPFDFYKNVLAVCPAQAFTSMYMVRASARSGAERSEATSREFHF